MDSFGILVFIILINVLISYFTLKIMWNMGMPTYSRKILLPVAFVLTIAIAEFLFTYKSSSMGIMVHVIIITAALFSPIYIKDLKLVRISQAFMLVSMLRLVNAALPLQDIYIHYQFLIIYSLLFLSCTVFIYYNFKNFGKVGIKRENFFRNATIGIPLGIVFGMTEYLILGTQPLFSTFFYASISIFFILGITEEVLFRGILQTSIEDINPTLAIVLSAIAFSIPHSIWVNPLEYLFTFYVGVVLSVLYYRTGSLIGPIVIHIVINFMLFQVIPFKIA